MDEDQFWLLVSLQVSGEATKEELGMLQELLKQHPEMGLRLQVLHDLWDGKMPARRRSEGLNRHLQRLSHHLSEPVLQYEEAVPAQIREPEEEIISIEKAKSRTWKVLWPVTGVAASLTALFIMIHQWAPGKKRQQCAQNTVSTKPGSRSKIQLPDGSQVWLNADSRITYDESFRGPSREVSLIGEAFFDIAKDKDHPFIIHAPSIDVRVLGTSLNIRSYSNDKNTETVLIRGSIEVTLRNNPEKKIILQPNEKLVVQNDKTSISAANNNNADSPGNSKPVAVTIGRAHFHEKDTVATEVLWTRNKLAFDKESLEDVAMKIERWYNVQVKITDERLKHTAYSGVFEEESLRQVMEALRLTGNFRYAINKKEITITP